MTSRLVVAMLVVAAVAAVAVGAYLLSYHGGAATPAHLQDVLIVESATGFNDSAGHGVPQNAWPVIRTTLGTTLNITVMNIDHQSHGFQVAHYYDSGIVAIPAGQSLHISFVANQSGTFQIYCEIPCTVHWAMQSGELIVS